jgi:hypothetical protein
LKKSPSKISKAASSKRKSSPSTSKTAVSKKKKVSVAVAESDVNLPPPTFLQIPVSRPGSKRSANSGSDDRIDKYFSIMMAQNQFERKEKAEEERICRMQERLEREEKREEERARCDLETDRQYRLDM